MINTVSGKISAKELGSVLCHEHIIAYNTAFKSVFEHLLLATQDNKLHKTACI